MRPLQNVLLKLYSTGFFEYLVAWQMFYFCFVEQNLMLYETLEYCDFYLCKRCLFEAWSGNSICHVYHNEYWLRNGAIGKSFFSHKCSPTFHSHFSTAGVLLGNNEANVPCHFVFQWKHCLLDKSHLMSWPPSVTS